MCGIVGIFDTRGKRPIDEALLKRMNHSQHHRGPDEDGLFVDPGIGLGHKRLSIIDLASGQQPLFNEDGSVVVVYNGEIYNFQELFKELAAAGHTFRTRCDTEAIVHAWEEWGEACVDRFRGMFAFAVWDRNKETLFLARDRLGIKPLYFAFLPNGEFIFGSELKALYEHAGLSRDIDPCAVEDYFTFGYIPEPRTIIRQANKLEPGHTLTLKRNAATPTPKAYWDVPFTPVDAGSEEDIAHELVERLREAVRIRLVAEVPLGAFLSGGVDSSAIVALMAGLEPDKPVNTCSIGFGEKRFNETEYADLIARQYKTNHHVEQVDPNDFDLLDKLVDLYDEPYADSSAIPTYRVCELARKRVIVAVSGDGGDENFAGYRRYRWHMKEEAIRQTLPQSMRGPLFGAMGRIYPKLDWAPKIFRAKSTFQALARNSMEAYLHSVSFLGDDQRGRLYSDNFKRELQGYHAKDVFERHAARAPTDDALSLIQYLDMKTYLPGDILTKVDRASMAHSLEVRVPLLDHKFVEWVSGLPSGMKLRGNEGKFIFKKSLEPLLPKNVLYRDKMGFGVPLANWFRGPLRERVRSSLLGESLLTTGLMNKKYLERLVREHETGVSDHSTAIWSLLMFEGFTRRQLSS